MTGPTFAEEIDALLPARPDLTCKACGVVCHSLGDGLWQCPVCLGRLRVTLVPEHVRVEPICVDCGREIAVHARPTGFGSRFRHAEGFCPPGGAPLAEPMGTVTGDGTGTALPPIQEGTVDPHVVHWTET